jgi:hypothetical protein
MRTLDITLPAGRGDDAIGLLASLDGVVGARLQRDASRRAEGDVITVQATNRAVPGILRELHDAGHLNGGSWTVAFSEPTGFVSPTHQRAIVSDDSEVSWEEMDYTIHRESSTTWNTLGVMATAGVLAAIGIATGALHLVIAGMVIAPGFAPIQRMSLALVAHTGDLGHGLKDTLLAYAALAAGAGLAGLVLFATGRPLLAGSTYLDGNELVRHWLGVNPPGLMVSTLAAAAGAVLIATNRSVLTAGVMIGLALVPPPVIAVLAALAGAWDRTLEGIFRWSVEAAIVFTAGVAVFAWKRAFRHRRTALTVGPRRPSGTGVRSP